MKKIFLALLTLVLMLSAVALAEVKVVSTTQHERGIYVSQETGCYYTRVDGGYQLFDKNGNALSAVYSNLTAKGRGLYYEYEGEGLNYIGLLDQNGQVVCAPSYGEVTVFDGGWALGYVLEATSAESGDFKDSSNNHYNVVHTDVFCDGKLVGTLTRDEYLPSYSEGVSGDYFFVKQTSSTGFFLDKNFNKYVVSGDFYTSSEYSQDWRTKVVTHVPTQQKAFSADCTLTADQVQTAVWYEDSNDSLLDLRGNVIKSGLVYDSVRSYGDYFSIRLNKLYGVMDLEGNVIIEPAYEELANYTGLYPNGIQLGVTPEGHLHFLDLNGNITAKVEYELSSSDYKGFSYNSSFVVVKNMGKILVFTATQGELPTKYEDYATPYTNHMVLLVQKDGLWGGIDVDGNTVIPFVHRYAPDMSADGTFVYGTTENREYVSYILSSDEKEKKWTETKTSGEEDTSAPVLADGAWECTCGTINTGKFCAECGSKKPEAMPTPAPAVDDGSWNCSCGSVNTGKFCPECGSKKPEAPTEPQCANCGYKPEGETPKFCPECGTKF